VIGEDESVKVSTSAQTPPLGLCQKVCSLPLTDTPNQSAFAMAWLTESMLV
jgi:hypothetical protein